MQLKARSARQPRAHLRVLVGAVVVDDEMHVERAWNLGLEMAQEREELLMAMARLALSEDLAVGHVEGGKQGGCAMAVVVVRHPLEVTQAHRQHGLRALERLDLALFVNAQHQCLVGRVEVEPDDVAHLLDEERIVGELEGFRAVGLNPEEREIALYAALGDASFSLQSAHAPVRGGLGLAPQGRVQQPGDAFLIDAAWPPGLGPIVQPLQALSAKPTPPAANHGRGELESPRRLRDRHACLGPQDHLRAPHQSVRQRARAGDGLQVSALLHRHLQRTLRSSSSHRRLHRPQRIAVGPHRYKIVSYGTAY